MLDPKNLWLNSSVVVQGYLMPPITLDNLARLNRWLNGINHTVTAWAAVSVIVDVGVCATSRLLYFSIV